MLLNDGYLACIFFLVGESFSTERFTTYNYRVKSCPKENWYSCEFKRERKCTSGGTTKFPCRRGIFYEEFNNCSYYELSKNFCDGGYAFYQILQFCDSKCSGRHEKIAFKCKSNPICLKVVYKRCSCKGKIASWRQWSSYSECTASCGGGMKTKFRYKCYDPADGTISSDCGSTSFNESYSTQCNTLSCDREIPSVPTTLAPTTRASKLSSAVKERIGGPTCDRDCDKILTHNLNIYEECSKSFTCNRYENVLLPCDENSSCRKLYSPVCPFYRRWTSWTQWNDSTTTQRRHRFQVCHHSLSGNQNACYKEAILETECKITDQRWITWLVLGVAAVIVLLCCFGVICYCFGKKQRLKKKRGLKKQSSQEIDDVFLHSDRSQASGLRSENKAGFMNRLERLSEHLYEAISSQSSRLRKRTSTNDESKPVGNLSWRSSNRQTQTEKVENEYTDKHLSFRRHDRDDGLQVHDDGTQRSRVSVLITDPDGRQVTAEGTERDSIAPALRHGVNVIDYVEMNNDSMTEEELKENIADFNDAVTPTMVISGGDVDSISIWSGSSFDSISHSDWEPSYRRVTNTLAPIHGENFGFNQHLDDESSNVAHVGHSVARSSSLAQYVVPTQTRPIKQKLKYLADDEKTRDHETLDTYLKMNQDRGTVKSWLNLRVAPLPRRKTRESDNEYCDANDLQGKEFRDFRFKTLSREQSLDEKYTTTPYTVPVTNNTMINATSTESFTDTEGYFNVSYSKENSKRLETAVAKETSKNVGRAPFAM